MEVEREPGQSQVTGQLDLLIGDFQVIYRDDGWYIEMLLKKLRWSAMEGFIWISQTYNAHTH